MRELSPLRVIKSGLCIGCGSCASQQPSEVAGMHMNAFGELQPTGSREWMHNGHPGLSRTCPFSPNALNENDLAAELYPHAQLGKAAGRILNAYVGHVRENGFRDRGSSGGMVSWVLEELLSKGLIDGVAHVAPCDPAVDGRFFRYRISRSFEEIRGGAKSRYYPIEASEILREIRAMPGRYAFVGVPCFIKAIHLLRREDPVLRERIAFTLGLFCGHMKSARFAESIAMQMEVPIEDVQAVDFRIKDPSRPASTYTAQFTLKDGSTRVRDWWNLVDGDWGSGYFQYSACNYCDDVIAETADISFGDAWVEPYSSDGRGTNVIVTRSPEIDELVRSAIEAGRLCLLPVDEDFVVQTQAAGFRQRREGLSYRLTWHKPGLKPRKRVLPLKPNSRRRRWIYRSRALISHWSHVLFRWSRKIRRAGFFVRPAKVLTAMYQGLAYHRDRWGAFFDKLLRDNGNSATSPNDAS